jgi:hypothetical protein
MKYVAYQTWQNPSWQSGPRYSERIYGVGDTPEEAIYNARYEERNGQVWQKRNAPNASNLSTRRAKLGEVEFPSNQ